MTEWFLKRGSKSFGPYSLQHVKALAAQGKLRHDDLVWSEEAQEWVAASTIDALFPSTPQDAVVEKPTRKSVPQDSVVEKPVRKSVPQDGIVEKPIRKPAGQQESIINLRRPTPAEPTTSGPTFLQRMRLWPKPLLFGTFGAIGGLLGALFLGELLWFLLAPVPPPPPEPVPPLQMRLADSLKVHPGGANHFQVKIARHGFNGKVKLHAVDLPDGVEVNAPALNGSEEQEQGKIEVTVADSVHPGKYDIAFKAVGPRPEKGDPPSAAGKLQLIVTAPPATLNMSVSPTVDVYRRGKAKFQVQIARGQFRGPVQLSFPKLPPGIVLRDVDVPATEDGIQVDLETTAEVKVASGVPLSVVARAKVKGDEVEDRQAFKLNVQQPPLSLALGVSPRVEVYRKGKARFVVRVARGNFDGPVQVSFLKTPQGVKLPNVEIAPDKSEAAVELEAGEDAALGIKDMVAVAQAEADKGKTLEEQQEFVVDVLPVPTSKADVLFVLDLTSSMQFAINGVRSGIADFARQLGKQNIDARIGMLGFRDIEDDLTNKDGTFVVFKDGKIIKKNYKQFDTLMKDLKDDKADVFTKDFTEFARLVGLLKASGGGDIPESSVQALLHSADQGFRPDSSKVIVFITDAPPKLKHFNRNTETVADAVKALLGAKIDQFHLVGRKDDLKDHFQPLMDAFPKTNSFNDINASLKDDAFAALLPKLSAEISRNTVAATPEAKVRETPALKPPSAAPLPESSRPVAPKSAAAADLPQPPPPPDLSIKAVQSTGGFSKDQGPRLILAVGVWTSVIAGAICLLLIAGQHFYLGRAWMTLPDFLKGCGGLVAGLLGGVVVQALFLATPGGTLWDIICRIIGWGLLGSMIGVGMALIVPNLKWFRGLLGGLLGGVIGALGFMLASLLAGEIGGRLLGAVILGFLIGVMIALAEMAFRRYWLELTFSAREVRTVTLGTAVVSVGGDEKLASIFVQDAPALALCYHLDGDRVLCEDKATGKTTEAPPGHRSQVGNVTVTVCSPESAVTLGLTLRLAGGRDFSLGDGMPLTAEDIPGLSPQGSDGTVALVSRRPNDPTTMMLRNRSKQTWKVKDAEGQQSEVAPGRAVELAANLSLDFGEVKAKLVSAKER